MYNSTLLFCDLHLDIFPLKLLCICFTNSNKHFETLYKYNSFLSCKGLWTTPINRRVVTLATNVKTRGEKKKAKSEPIWWTCYTSHSELLWSFFCHLFCNTVLPDNVAPYAIHDISQLFLAEVAAGLGVSACLYRGGWWSLKPSPESSRGQSCSKAMQMSVIGKQRGLCMEQMLKGSLQSAMKEIKSAWKKQQGTLNIYIHETGSSPADKDLGQLVYWPWSGNVHMQLRSPNISLAASNR